MISAGARAFPIDGVRHIWADDRRPQGVDTRASVLTSTIAGACPPRNPTPMRRSDE
jgi:hypothetical protein